MCRFGQYAQLQVTQASVAIGEDHQVIAALALFGNGSLYSCPRVLIDGAHEAHAALRAIVGQ
jgi:hypothetical protein